MVRPGSSWIPAGGPIVDLSSTCFESAAEGKVALVTPKITGANIMLDFYE